MVSIKKIFFSLLIFLSAITLFSAQIKNQKTEIVKIYGNCEMCKQTIEKVGSIPDESLVLWDVKTKQAEITYDSNKTSIDKILKRIALVGYDNEKYKAKDGVYRQLPICCQYERKK